jgi:hypothetical protein
MYCTKVTQTLQEESPYLLPSFLAIQKAQVIYDLVFDIFDIRHIPLP